MKLTIFKSKLHQMRVTEANLLYEGSITIDEDLLDPMPARKFDLSTGYPDP